MKVDESVKFAWAYLLLHGKETDGCWCFYGARWEHKDRKMRLEDVYKSMETIRTKATKVGIDWEKTGVPEVEEQDSFAGTFTSYTHRCLATLGRLVLKNGESFLIGSSDDDAAHLAETARRMLEGKNTDVENLAKKL